MKTFQTLLTVAALSLAFNDAIARDEKVGAMAEKGDPARWAEPADTPQKKYQAAMKEAVAAQAEALAECRTARADRKSCETAAREEFRRDAQMARALLSSPTR